MSLYKTCNLTYSQDVNETRLGKSDYSVSLIPQYNPEKDQYIGSFMDPRSPSVERSIPRINFTPKEPDGTSLTTDEIGFTLVNRDTSDSIFKPSIIEQSSSVAKDRSLASSFSRVNPQSFQEGRMINTEKKKPAVRAFKKTHYVGQVTPTSISTSNVYTDELQMKKQLAEIVSRPSYNFGYICKRCKLALNGHSSIQGTHPHDFVSGEYRELTPREYGPWYPGGKPYL